MKWINYVLFFLYILYSGTGNPEIEPLPDIIPCNEWMSYNRIRESWVCEKGYVRLPAEVRDSIYRDAVRRLKNVETNLNIKP